MSTTTIKRQGLLLAAVVCALVTLSACGPLRGTSQSQADVSNAIGMSAGSSNTGATKQWMVSHEANRTVDVRVVSGVNGNAQLNGYPNGVMTISIPQHWRVRLTFQNNNREAMYRPLIVPYSEWPSRRGQHAIYPPKPGMMKGTLIPPGHADTETFAASTLGRYVLVTSTQSGRRSVWANVVISSHEPTPRIYTPVEG